MKKFNVLFMALPLILAFSSCANNKDDSVYFIHAVGFDTAGNNISMCAVAEKTTALSAEKSKNDSTVFEILRFEDSTTKKCYKKLKDYCNKSYFGTSETYFLSTGLTSKNLNDICSYLPSDSNLPSRSSVCAVVGMSAYDFLSNAKNSEFFSKINSLLKNKRVNIVTFLGKSFQANQTIILPALSYHENPVNMGYAKCNDNYFEVQ